MGGWAEEDGWTTAVSLSSSSSLFLSRLGMEARPGPEDSRAYIYCDSEFYGKVVFKKEVFLRDLIEIRYLYCQ